LSQLGKDDKEHVIAYASRSLNQAEKNYSITDQECLAVVWAIKHFQHYLGMKPFEIVTDHSTLKWLQTCKILKGKRARWIMELQQYDFSIRHQPGKTNANADALSRINEEPTECYIVSIKADAEEQILGRPRVCLTCGRWSGGETWNQGHYYSRARGNYLCGFLDDQVATIKYLANPSEYSDDSDEDDINIITHEDHPKIVDLFTCELPFEEYLACFSGNIVQKQVIAGQPIQREGSRCTFSCDIENHHIHNYCKACKTNLPYGTILYDCIIKFGNSKIQLNINLTFLVNTVLFQN